LSIALVFLLEALTGQGSPADMQVVDQTPENFPAIDTTGGIGAGFRMASGQPATPCMRNLFPLAEKLTAIAA
jgi:hypothetical protein